MLHETKNSDHAERAPHAIGEWWERVLERLEPAMDFVEARIVDPFDEAVTPRIKHGEALLAHRRVSATRRLAEHRAVHAWPWRYAQRARLLSTWAGLETAAAGTRHDLHDAAHADSLFDGGGCCASLIRLHHARAAGIRALAVVEDQTATSRSPNFGSMSGRVRRLAGREFEALACSYSMSEQSSIAERVIKQLRPEFGAAVKPVRELHVEQRWRW